MRSGDSRSLRADRCKGVRSIAAEDIGLSPQCVGNDAHIETRSVQGIERMIVVAGHAGHHEGSLRTECSAQCFDEAGGSIFDGSDLRKSRVHQKHSTRPDAQCEELLNQGVYADGVQVAMAPTVPKSAPFLA